MITWPGPWTFRIITGEIWTPYIMEDACIGISWGDQEDIPAVRLEQVKKVFRDAQENNPHLCVIFSETQEEGNIP